MTKIVIYPLSYDTGFAPNPYGGMLTFGCCMSKVRKIINEDDILIGVGSKRLDNILAENNVTLKGSTDGKILYIAVITKKMPHVEYSKFVRDNILFEIAEKIPSIKNKTGDSIYEFNCVPENKIGLVPNLHLLKSWNDPEKLLSYVKDDISEDVLVSTHYLYFGDAFPDTTIKQLDGIINSNKNNYTIGDCLTVDIDEEIKLLIHEYILNMMESHNTCMLGNPCSSYAELDLTHEPKNIDI
jgi:hypothetical protein